MQKQKTLKDIIKDIPYAKLFATRHAFKNYLAFVNPLNESKQTIFHTDRFKEDLKETTVSSEINSIKNDPSLKTIGVGIKILINDAERILLNK